ncbi:Chemotaxis protein [Halorhabdus tiamatea SARL4B]|uniref:Chemotaxis protein n=1 Tax=Halorhabdus tiamatea SARL4B TaxID=1033806 RepID=F7PLY5_9EURY|nr:chemotaxis protein CheC [Halorhabdus tiamatea]ERJ06405.1 Chemotaxis protein [Halorhabdus tiamatea SARL4B]CCQ34575.1 chemotaxis protein CheC--inhibitor of MCP methylation [Halorhabdus tiamatea SARL4B]
MSLEVDVRKLDLFNKIAKEGSERVSDHLNQMAGLSTQIAVSKINFLDIEDVRTHMGDGDRVGIFVELTEAPYGYVLFMLEPRDAKELAGMLVGGGSDDTEGFSDMERSAIQEVGNIMTSGYIDGWANVLDTTIEMSTPSFAYGPAGGIVDKMGGWPDEDIAFVIDSEITAGDGDVSLTIYTFPKLVDLVELIQGIDVSTVVGEDTVVSADIAEEL